MTEKEYYFLPSQPITNTNPFAFNGTLKKIQICSDNLFVGLHPDQYETVEQRLTILDDGRVWISRYRFNEELFKFENTKVERIKISETAVNNIIKSITQCFSGKNRLKMVGKARGSWKVTLINTEGRAFPYDGFICSKYKIGGSDLSDIIRKNLGKSDLIVFDGNPNKR